MRHVRELGVLEHAGSEAWDALGTSRLALALATDRA
jgi:hypothetical protein